MKVTYTPGADALMMDQGDSSRSATSVGRNSGLIAEFKGPLTDDDPEVMAVAALEILDFSMCLPMDKSGLYEADRDTRLFGDKLDPDAEYQIVENDDFVAYWRKFTDEDGDWYMITTVALRRATHHLGKVIARHPKLRNAK